MMETKVVRISGGDLPDGYSVKIPLTIDYTEATKEELIPRAMRSDVIAWQGRQRKLTVNELNKMAEKGVSITSKEISTSVSSGMSYKQLLMNLGMSEEKAVAVMNDPEKLDAVKKLIRENLG